jgi:hypothetical protein
MRRCEQSAQKVTAPLMGVLDLAQTEVPISTTPTVFLYPDTVSAETLLMIDQLKRTKAPKISPDLLKRTTFDN